MRAEDCKTCRRCGCLKPWFKFHVDKVRLAHYCDTCRDFRKARRWVAGR